MFVKLLQIIQSYDVFRGPCNCNALRLTITDTESNSGKQLYHHPHFR